MEGEICQEFLKIDNNKLNEIYSKYHGNKKHCLILYDKKTNILNRNFNILDDDLTVFGEPYSYLSSTKSFTPKKKKIDNTENGNKDIFVNGAKFRSNKGELLIRVLIKTHKIIRN